MWFFFPLATVVPRSVGLTLVVVRYLLRMRVFWLHFVLDAFSDVVFAVLLQSPPSSCDVVSLFLMLLSLALSVPLHPRLFVSFVL